MRKPASVSGGIWSELRRQSLVSKQYGALEALVVSRKSRRHISMWSLVLRKAGTHYEEVGIRRAVTGIEAGSKRS